MNCIDDECKYLLHTFEHEAYCSLLHQEIPDDIDITQCDNFVQARTCLNCVHSISTVYETGTIDDIEYRCPFQGKKVIYDDTDVWHDHYANVPECNIDRFEKNDQIDRSVVKLLW